jgi:RimJ/RimL family protein N-acetyltransferase
MTTTLRGARVRLAAAETKEMSEAFARWTRNTTYYRLLDTDPAILWSTKKWNEWLEKDFEKPDPGPEHFFQIRLIEGDRLIGFTALFGIQQQHGDSLVAIGLGEADTWGQGYGTEAMDLLLGYVFNELGLYRVSLFVFDYNKRGIRSYEKNGYRLEGTLRKAHLRSGQRWDIHMMGVLRPDWEAARLARAV